MFRSPQEMHTFIQIVENITNADSTLIGNEPQIEPIKSIKDPLLKLALFKLDPADDSRNRDPSNGNNEQDPKSKKQTLERKL